ncbi:MAG: 50S ribosomal protein L18 [Pseudomonadota bacterium]
MSKKVRKVTSKRYAAQTHRKQRVRSKVYGTAECPRMNMFKSDSHIMIQLIDDENGRTLLQCSTMQKELRDTKPNIEGAKKIGKIIAQEAIKKNIKKVVFDRGGHKYHGVVKALADSARETGLIF